MKNLSGDLRKFFEDWLAWAENREEHTVLEDWKECGLCVALEYWWFEGSSDLVEFWQLGDELDELFEYCKLDPDFPFGLSKYKYMVRSSDDPNRVNFVKAALAGNLKHFRLEGDTSDNN